MGKFIYAEHPEGCSLQLFYRTSPCKERGSCPFRCGSDSVAVTICCMGEIIYAEHPEGCSLQLFYRTSPCKECGSCPFRVGASRLPLYVIVWVSLFTRNTQRDVPYSCSFLVSHNEKIITFESNDSTTLLCRVENSPPPDKLYRKNYK